MKQVVINLKECCEECPYFHYDNGGGHGEPSDYCSKRRREIFIWKKAEMKDGFPTWCPLPEK